ncbi:tyrosine-type recombinase/integrase [Allokutzneria albata]|uniref:tyrosine-type recombinase/integrase n=1 Tax=Allokutzneria albata TaxID=211114 RepID=UPI00138E248B|nr:tyrosine-type recombinase/integrase [Allokutzneria albata]
MTLDSEMSIVQTHLLPAWEDTELNKILRNPVQMWVDKLAAKYAPKTVSRIYGVFRASLLAAVKYGVLSGTPCVDIKLPKLRTVRSKPTMMRSDLDDLYPHITPSYRFALEMCFNTGMRPGEFGGLHRHSINLKDGWLNIRDVFVYLPRKEGVREEVLRYIKEYPKDEEAREVPLPGHVVDMARLWIEENPARSGCGIPHRPGNPCKSDVLFRTPRTGLPLSNRTFENVLRYAWRRAKLPHIPPYGARRGYATTLAEAGVDPYEIARLMGHATLEQTMVYTQRTPAARARIVAALGDHDAVQLQLVPGTARDASGTEPDSKALTDAQSDQAQKLA